MRVYRVFLLVIFLCVIASSTFAAPIIPSYWVWNAPASGDTYQVNNDTLFIRTGEGRRDMWNAERGKAPLYTTVAPNGDWTFEAKFDMPARVESTHVGLVIWNGAEKKPVRALYVGPYQGDRISIEGSYAATASGHASTLKRQAANSGAMEVNYTEFSGYLRAQKVGNQYRFFFRSTPTESWRDLGTVVTGETFTRLGFITKVFGSNPVEVTFSEIHIYK